MRCGRESLLKTGFFLGNIHFYIGGSVTRLQEAPKSHIFRHFDSEHTEGALQLRTEILRHPQ